MKIYEKPEIKIIFLDTEDILASSIMWSNEEASDEYDVLINKRRGGWEDIWNNNTNTNRGIW